MEDGLSVAFIVSGLAAAGFGVVIAVAALIFGFIALFVFWWREAHRTLALSRFRENPILGPESSNWWESEAVFNPAAIIDNGRVHLFYRALGRDGISRIGYASSKDGITFDERLPYPVFEPRGGFSMPAAQRRYGPLSYNTQAYASGGGWAGSEDPRAVKIDGQLYLTFTAFDGWGFIRMALTSLPHGHFLKRDWDWKRPTFLSPPNEIHKNWVLFPEKIRGKFAVLHSLAPEISVEYVDDLNAFEDEDTHIQSNYHREQGRPEHWDKWVRGAGAPPLKTPHGWLLFYHGFDPAQSHIGYKVGVMLLDLKDPTVVLARSSTPVLEPKEWYEHDWKPHVVMATGAVIFGDDILVYYGGGDKHIAAARANLDDFVRRLRTDDHAALEPVRI